MNCPLCGTVLITLDAAEVFSMLVFHDVVLGLFSLSSSAVAISFFILFSVTIKYVCLPMLCIFILNKVIVAVIRLASLKQILHMLSIRLP